MKTKLWFFLSLPVIMTGLKAQPVPDLILQREITPAYVTYLATREAAWLYQVNFVGGDIPETMRAHLGLAILSYAWSHVEGDTMLTELDPLLEDIGTNLDSLQARLEADILPLIDPLQMESFLTDLTDFFNSGTYVDFRDSMRIYLDSIGAGLENSVATVEIFLGNVQNNFSQEQYADHLLAIFDGTAGFQFTLQILDGPQPDSLYIFSRTFFNRLEALDSIGDNMMTHFETGGAWLDSVNAITGADVMPGINSLRAGLLEMSRLVDTLAVCLNNQPLAPLEIDTAPLDSLQIAIVEIDTLLGGKEYAFGPESEGKTIKPLAIIQNLPGTGIQSLYWDFYRQSNPGSYTFGGIFPAGLDIRSLDLLSVDAVLNSWDNQSLFEARLDMLMAAWMLDLFLNPDDPDAALGAGMYSLYQHVQDNSSRFEDIFRLLSAGRIDSVTYRYDWESVNILQDLDEVDQWLRQYTHADTPTHFVLLVKTQPDGYGPYIIGPGSEFEIINLPVPAVELARLEIKLVTGGLRLITDGISALYAELDDIFILTLDPTVLDLSSVESDSDFILLLEQSNPEFLTVTPYGITRFHEIGDDLEQGFQSLHNFYVHMVSLAQAMAPYEADFGMNGSQFISEMEFMEAATHLLWQDFAYPDSTVTIEGERVNFSAWFDNPPASFLIMWKNFVFGIDSTLGGLFPDRPQLDISAGEIIPLPRQFQMYAAYPNPFNPLTRISFDLPRRGSVQVEIFDLRGVRIATLLDQELSAGRKILTWNATGHPSGIYFCRIIYQGQASLRKLMLLK